MKSEQINELGAALAKAQGEIVGASKDCSNPFFKSKYADLSNIWDACRAALSKHGLCVSQIVEQTETGDVLCAMLIHSSGQWISSNIPLRIKADGKTNELQALGSTITYLRRFSLAAIVGVAPADEDDDGNAGKNYQSRPEPMQPVAPKIITKEQAEDLKAVVAKCSPVMQANIEKLMKDRNLNGFQELGETLYKSLVEKAMQDMKYYQASLSKEEVSITP